MDATLLQSYKKTRDLFVLTLNAHFLKCAHFFKKAHFLKKEK